MGPPFGNINAVQHGRTITRRAAAKGLRPRKLPKGFAYVRSEVNDYATALHAATVAAHGEVGRNHLETIESAAAWHLHSLYTLRTLRLDHDALKPEQRVQLSSEIAKAVQKRADQVRLLGIPDRGPVDPFNGTLDAAIAESINTSSDTTLASVVLPTEADPQ